MINGRTGTVTGTIGVGAYPDALAVSPQTGAVYVTNAYDNTVSVINGKTNTVTSTVGVGDQPVGVAVSPRTGKVYVTNFYDNTVSVIGMPR